ncbi:MAG TPA: ABC transporter substrate-binding protein [Anaeromyxobacteraceae bacterium]|nr:ABC transporter substrate-binding protein [Anaeromyxobacteraceae bacterium]
MTPRKSLAAILSAALLPATAAAQQEIKVGGIFDLTGVTSDVGKPFAQGVQDCVAVVNDAGGIAGRKVKLIGADYAYKIPQAQALYKKLVNDDKVIMIQGWGTGDTEALKEFVGQDKIPYFSGSFAAPLSDPAKFPYNFFVAPTYSEQLRSWLDWVKQDYAKSGGKGKPKVAFMYGDNAYGKAPIAAGKKYAAEIGVDVVDEAILPPNFQDAKSQLLVMKSKGVEYAYINVTTTGVSLVLRDAKTAGMNVKFGSNPYGFSETLPKVAGANAEGVTGVVPHVPYGTPVPGMATLEAAHKKYHPTDTHDAMYVRGWATCLVWMEGLKRAAAANNLTGAGVKAAIETLSDFSTGGLSQSVTYTPTDHRPTMTTSIYQIQGGKLVKIGDYIMPRTKEWFGL